MITSYRLDLLVELCKEFEEVGIVTSKGEEKGTLKLASYEAYLKKYKNLKIYELSSLKISYTGESRGTSFFLYPQVVFKMFKYDILLLEGVTNLINNCYLAPISRLFGKKIIWWDPGYSRAVRTKRRKLIDGILKPFVKLTQIQMSYSTMGEEYLKNYMGAKNCFTNLNTINTNYFESIQNEVSSSIDSYNFDDTQVRLLYVGVVEKRKKVEELIKYVTKLNELSNSRKFVLNIIGGGNQLEYLRNLYDSQETVFHGPIYDKEMLKKFYFESDLFVLPGDGGLGILQSLLYGLPVLCIKGADGTESDYIDDENFILNSTEEIYDKLRTLKNINRKSYKNYVLKVSSEQWIERLISRLA